MLGDEIRGVVFFGKPFDQKDERLKPARARADSDNPHPRFVSPCVIVQTAFGSSLPPGYEGGFDRFQQVRLVEWFGQKVVYVLFDRIGHERLVSVSAHYDDGRVEVFVANFVDQFDAA